MAKAKRIDQFVNSFADYDAVGNHLRFIQKELLARGFESEIFVEQNLAGNGDDVHILEEYQQYDSPENVVIYQHSIGTRIPKFLLTLSAYKILSYHNVTPAKYFVEFSEPCFYEACQEGIRQLDLLRLSVDATWTVSEYNAAELRRCGFEDIQVFPILRDYGYLNTCEKDQELVELFRTDERDNLLFVSRLTPHKGQAKLFEIMGEIKKVNASSCRLILIGGNLPIYLDHLRKQAKSLGLKLHEGDFDQAAVVNCDIWITHQISEAKMSTIFSAAKLYVSLSEHEGFGVPLVEAMSFGLPIMALGAAGVPETLGEAGCLLNGDPVLDAKTIGDALNNSEVLKNLGELSTSAMKRFELNKIKAEFHKILENTI